MTAAMTSRQRVRAALNHQPTDRVPVDLGASRITGIGAIAYQKMLPRLGIKETVRVCDVKQQIDTFYHGTDKALFAGLPMFVQNQARPFPPAG